MQHDEHSESVCNTDTSHHTRFQVQSGTTGDVNIMRSGNGKYENVQFVDQHLPYSYDMLATMDPTRRATDLNDATLDQFFSRPIRLAQYQWDTNATLFQEFNPWSLYLENARVGNRLCNYNLMRAKLHLKFVINGNGFHFGRAIASYLPLSFWDDFSTNASTDPTDLIQASQQPHVYLNPTTSTGGEMVLPFFNFYNQVNITEEQWQELGVCTLRHLNILRHANDAVDKATISVFGWIEDVSMNVLTSVEPTTLVPQSGKEVDMANREGMISGPATAVAKAAGALGMIPEIAPFAIATQSGATMVAKVAKALGYCSPPVTKDPEPYKPSTSSQLAVTTVPAGLKKLTVDDKQELSIDPRIAGVGGTDPLNIKEIAKRESYLTKFSWDIGQSPDTLLWNCRVDPVMWDEIGSPPAMRLTASAMAALPFKYWTGTMKFRFQIVCSAHHKGRLRIVYDPNFLAVSDEFNVNYMEIVDIADKTDFTIEVGIGQETNWLSHALPGLTSKTDLYGSSTFASRSNGNGVIGVYIVNELTTPNSVATNDIEVNVFVSMGDDFEVAVPDDHIQRMVFKPQSGKVNEMIPEAFGTDEPDAPQQEEASSIGPRYTNHDLLGKVFMGEAIQSFRPLLKRYNLHSNLIWGESSAPRVHFGRRCMYPYFRGNVSGAVDLRDTGAGTAAYNYSNTVLMHWVTQAFSGWRGSTRWKILPRGEMNSDRLPAIYVQRAPLGGSEFQRGSATTTALFTSANEAAASAVVDPSGSLPASTKPLSGMNGAAYNNGRVNPTLEFEVPYYSPLRFTPGKQQNYTSLAVFDECWDYRIYVDGNVDTCFDAWVAAGFRR